MPRLATSIPSMTRPKTQCLPSRWGQASCRWLAVQVVGFEVLGFRFSGDGVLSKPHPSQKCLGEAFNALAKVGSYQWAVSSPLNFWWYVRIGLMKELLTPRKRWQAYSRAERRRDEECPAKTRKNPRYLRKRHLKHDFAAHHSLGCGLGFM